MVNGHNRDDNMIENVVIFHSVKITSMNGGMYGTIQMGLLIKDLY